MLYAEMFALPRLIVSKPSNMSSPAPYKNTAVKAAAAQGQALPSPLSPLSHQPLFLTANELTHWSLNEDEEGWCAQCVKEWIAVLRLDHKKDHSS